MTGLPCRVAPRVGGGQCFIELAKLVLEIAFGLPYGVGLAKGWQQHADGKNAVPEGQMSGEAEQSHRVGS